MTPEQVARGRYLSESPKRARGEAVIDLGYARQNDIAVGDEAEVAGQKFEVVGLASAPLGGDASNAYVELGGPQELSDRESRVNGIQVRATNLSSKLGTALAIVALAGAFLIATLLTLSSVQKRIRELGTSKALGRRQRLVVRQVAGESLAQGALGGVVGAALGIGGAAIIDAIGPTLEASVEAQSSPGFNPFGQGTVTSGSTDVILGAPVDPGLALLAIGLAIVGGLLAGAAGGWRAARLRPAGALRSAE